jgi:Lon protease-like protein
MHCDSGAKKTLSAWNRRFGEGYALFVRRKNAKIVIDAGRPVCVGTICRIRQVFRIQNDTVHLLVTGAVRARIVGMISRTRIIPLRWSN